MLRRRIVRLRRQVFLPSHVSLLSFHSGAALGQTNRQPDPITAQDFWEASQSIWQHKQAKHVGIAVSGGVDSMALAALCAAAKRDRLSPHRYTALIVDHAARKGSRKEAEWVAEQLRSQLHMESRILSLDWTNPTNILRQTNFESHARTQRYRALGLACRDLGIESLLVAHHSEDQAETMIMRIVQGRRRAGLQGIQAVTNIPECFGIHGVYQSTMCRQISDLMPGRPSLPIDPETGGIRVIRPLLLFRKARLIATCQRLAMPWVEDATNRDRTLTQRNAVRHVIRKHALPVALRNECMNALACRMQEKISGAKQDAEALFDACDISLDTASGSVIICFSSPFTMRFNDEADRHRARNIASLFLNRICGLVSPLEAIQIGQLDIAVDRMFPSLGRSNAHHGGFTTAGLQFQPGSTSSLSINMPMGHSHLQRWIISRQPYKSRERDKILIKMSNNGPTSDQAMDSIATLNVEGCDGQLKYQLFDGRFWIHVRSSSQGSVVVRALCQSDMSRIASSSSTYSKKSSRMLRTSLDTVQPPTARWTLPVLFQINNEGAEQFLGLPTLGFRMHGPLIDDVTWHVKYKQIDLGKHDPRSVLTDTVRDRMRTRIAASGSTRKASERKPGMTVSRNWGRSSHHKRKPAA